MTEYQNVNYAIKNRVATIALNRPDTLNAFSQGLRQDLLATLTRAVADDDVRVIVLTGEGRGFSSGADLTEDTAMYPSFVEQCEAEYKPFLMAMENSPKLIIAAVNGVAAGIGSAVVMHCDLVMMADDAYIYQAFSAIGLMPDGGATQLLVQRLGYHRALEMAVDAGRLTAAECLDLGLANKQVESQRLRQEAQEWAEHLAQGAPLAQQFAKQLMRKATLMSYSDVVDEEAVLQSRCIASEDAKIGVTAFLDKRKATFIGK
ncbi:MAG: 2-(1,2-epoxy-1,2-dihydrophenyl)acetyl-CoA isomerase [Arenicella sp.]|jgi:2-(1,2-epoxy-1,2-dihydrophenyl)acetyl-CoA isomerase